MNVKLDGPTDYGKLKAMVDSGNVDWDVVDVEGDFAVAAAKAGLLEPLDFSTINKADLDPRFTADNYIGSFYYSFVLGYNKGALGGKEPKNWADLFDTKAYPGKRTFYKWSAPGVLEIALLQPGLASLTSYAPINTKSAKLMPAAEAATLPDQHTQSQINLDMNYWAAHRDEIGKRWYDWQAK